MAILPRNLLKSFFETGDKPNESQFGALIDSMLHSTEDQAKLGLRAYDATRTYIAGEAVINNGSLFQALVTTTGTFNPSHWQKILSLGSVTYQGTWDAVNNVPTLTSGQGTKGDYYVVSVTGTTLLDGNSTWAAGDEVIFNGTSWERVINADLDEQTAAEVSYSNVTSGMVADDVQEAIDEIDARIDSLTTSNVAEGTNLYYTDARVAAAPSVTALDASVSALQTTVTALPWESFTSVAGETARLDSATYVGIIPNTDSSADLGISATRWRDLYIAGNIDFSSTLAVKSGSTTIAQADTSRLVVGDTFTNAQGNLCINVQGAAGQLFTLNNNAAGVSVIGNYIAGTSNGLSAQVTGSTYAGGSGMTVADRTAVTSRNLHMNVGTETDNSLSLWTNNTERVRINGTGSITHLSETAFNKRTYYLDGAVDTDLDWSRGNTFHKRLEADATITFSNNVDLQTIVVGIEQNGTGGFNVTWPAGVRWPNGTTPTPTSTAGKTDVYTFVQLNGVIYGNVIQNF